MAFKIIAENCTGCGACQFECPNNAISSKGGVFSIIAGKCTECKGIYKTQQCAAACPIPKTCIKA